MIPLFKPFMPAELPEVDNILHSGVLSFGKWGREFENKLKAFIGNDNILTTNTYSNAIHIALATLGLQPGDEVIASPMACLASNQPLVTFGLKVVWADIDPSIGTLNPESVAKAITPKTKLIYHNHFCGYVGYVDEIYQIAREHGLLVIDDCVEAFGSEYNGKRMGNLGADASVFSFQTVRLPNTIDGGAIAFSDAKYMAKATLIRDFGIDRPRFRDQNGEISPDCDIALKGYAGTVSDFNSYIGCVQMEHLEELLAKQKKNAVEWQNRFDQTSSMIKAVPIRKGVSPNYWVFGVLSDHKVDDMLMFREQGYYASGVHLPNCYYSVYGEQIQLPGVQEFYNKFFALPSGWWM